MAYGFGPKHPERLRAFCAAAWEEGQKDQAMVRLGQDTLERYAAIWYQMNERAILRGNYETADEAVRHIAGELREAGFSLNDFLGALRLFRATAVRLRWNEEQLEELDAVIDVLLPQLGDVPEDWRVPVGFSYREGRVIEEAPEAPHPPEGVAAEHKDKRGYGRTKISLPVRITFTEPPSAPHEITRTANISRTGIYIHSTREYAPGMRLFVCCPYSKEPDAINREYLSQVVRIDLFPRQADRGIAIKFLQTI